jgi:hypothetical protein
MTRIWAFLPAILVFAGAVLVAFGTLWTAWRQSNFNAAIIEKNAEIARLQRESANAITGGDSFAYMLLSVGDPNTGATVVPVFVHHGKYPLYDLEARIVDLDAPRTTENLRGRVFQIGSLTPGFSTSTAALAHPSGRDLSYNVFFVARNGAWTQQLRMRLVGDGYAIANKITGLAEGKEIFRDVSQNYPRGPDGEVEWERKPPPAASSQ